MTEISIRHAMARETEDKHRARAVYESLGLGHAHYEMFEVDFSA